MHCSAFCSHNTYRVINITECHSESMYVTLKGAAEIYKEYVKHRGPKAHRNKLFVTLNEHRLLFGEFECIREKSTSRE
jgi:hypothetical protein